MRILEVFDKHDYDELSEIFFREAVRAIIIKDHKIAMIKGKKYEEYKFPGGGIEKGESDEVALIRETKEETGLSIIPETITPYGMMHEKRRSVFNPEQIFEMYSRYYLCQSESTIDQTDLDDYEIEYGYQLEFISIDEAIKNNELAKKHQHIATWIERELYVLKRLKEEGLM